MKMIVKTDMLLQTLMVLAWVMLVTAAAPGKSTLLVGMILMNWQIMSCLMMILFTGKNRRERVAFIITAVTFQVSINSLYVAAPAMIGSSVLVIVNVLPPILCGFYYMLTLIAIYRRNTHKGNFLPHISF